jgi:hypothetical protein
MSVVLTEKLPTCVAAKVAAISGAGQQHGSVFLKEPLRDTGRWRTNMSLVDQVRPVCADLTSSLARFDGYGSRFDAAVAGVEAGDVDLFTKPSVDSAHTVWFELHENLLATLGIERGSEATS